MTRVLLFLLISLSTACSLRNIEPPEVSLVDISTGSASLFETSILTEMRYENLSNEPLEIKGAVHRLYINGLDLGRGALKKRVNLPAYGTYVEKVEFRINNLNALQKLSKLVDSDNFSYQIESKLDTDAGTFNISDSEQSFE